MALFVYPVTARSISLDWSHDNGHPSYSTSLRGIVSANCPSKNSQMSTVVLLKVVIHLLINPRICCVAKCMVCITHRLAWRSTHVVYQKVEILQISDKPIIKLPRVTRWWCPCSYFTDQFFIIGNRHTAIYTYNIAMGASMIFLPLLLSNIWPAA